MKSYYRVLPFLLLHVNLLKADTSTEESQHSDVLLLKSGIGYMIPFPEKCSEILSDFADYASNFTKCSILHARPIRICKNCIEHYTSFHNKYQELLTTVVNGTSCKSVFISRDRLDAILEYHDNIKSIWDKGHCNACYDWKTGQPVLSNETIHFNELFNQTIDCIMKYIVPSSNDSKIVCDNCMQSYIKLDNYYKTLSADAIGVDIICMDIVDSSQDSSKAFCVLLEEPIELGSIKLIVTINTICIYKLTKEIKLFLIKLGLNDKYAHFRHITQI
ncbi:hypothetical protein HF086_016906 [Spodoptera exigua]|uniref:Osteopetrosis-associated transmembrane protein 1 n=1 Tax=Spodoptera exigua TaxID=7107 RepID=A0A922SF48_SPOEX|nr:hypothetical protein HF086_016906 [Spodoptera exigua]